MTLLSKRSFLKGLFVAPAIVAATNIMPVKVMEALAVSPGGVIIPTIPQGLGPVKLITDLSDIEESSSILAAKWNLVDLGNGNLKWMSDFNRATFKHYGDVVNTMEVAEGREIDTTVTLMKSAPGSSVIWEIPSHMRSYK